MKEKKLKIADNKILIVDDGGDLGYMKYCPSRDIIYYVSYNNGEPKHVYSDGTLSRKG